MSAAIGPQQLLGATSQPALQYAQTQCPARIRDCFEVSASIRPLLGHDLGPRTRSAS